MTVIKTLAAGAALLALACSSAGSNQDAIDVLSEVDAGPMVMREGLVVGDPTAEGIDETALSKLIAAATSEHSEALVVLRNGKLVYEDYFGAQDEPIYAMSASKSFTSLAYGFLLADGKLASLDELVVTVLPDFAESDARKAKITFRHLLSHTSGLDPRRSGGTKGDILAHGISVACVFDPGTSWQYNNDGVDLLAALAGVLAGQPMDAYLDQKLFHPLGIVDVSWLRDKEGVPLGAGELRIRPLDMAKVGQAMLDRGKWQGKQVIPESWVETSVASSSSLEPLYGLLWWRDAEVTAVGLTRDVLDQWLTAGLAPTIAAKVEPLVARAFADEDAYLAALRAVLTSAELRALDALIRGGDHIPYMRTMAIGAVRGFNAAGWLGQFLVVSPDRKLVAVRMRRARDTDYESQREVDGFPTFPSSVLSLVP